MNRYICNLPSYDRQGHCGSCGAGPDKISPRFDYESGHLWLSCAKDSYSWLAAPLFAFGEPFIFRPNADAPCVACGNKGHHPLRVVMKHLPGGKGGGIGGDRWDISYHLSSGYVTDTFIEYLDSAAGGDVSLMLPLVSHKCGLCRFAWLETPLNRATRLEPVFPQHECGA